MCKILAVAGIKNTKKYQNNAHLFLEAVQKPLCQNDKDGFGYATISHNAELFMEKWMYPKDAFDKRDCFGEAEQLLDARYPALLELDETYTYHGTPTPISAFIAHSRMATCEKSIDNTHPFVSLLGDTILIHNGIIRNPQEYLKRSTCDSEAILIRYEDLDVRNNPDKLSDALTPLSGYYAVAALGHTDTGIPYLDVFKDNQAYLTMCLVPELGHVFCTQAAIVMAACKALKWAQPKVYNVSPFRHVRLHAVTGLPIHNSRIKTESKPAVLTKNRGYTHAWRDEDYAWRGEYSATSNAQKVTSL